MSFLKPMLAQPLCSFFWRNGPPSHEDGRDVESVSLDVLSQNQLSA